MRAYGEADDPELAERAAYWWLRRVYTGLTPAVEPGEPLSRPIRRKLVIQRKLGRLVERGERKGLVYGEIVVEGRALLDAEEGYSYRLAVAEADKAGEREPPKMPARAGAPKAARRRREFGPL